MLIIPLHRKPTAANWPWVTTLVIVLNVLVFFAWQGRDARFEAAAQIRYFELELDQIELPLYREYRAAGHGIKLPFDFAEMEAELSGPQRQQVVFAAIDLDGPFQRALTDGGALAGARAALDPQQRWTRQRAEVEQLLQRSVSWSYSLRYDRIEFSRLLGWMFLHSDLFHLLGNMLFVFLLGLLVEGALGAPLYAALYLLGGIGSGLFCLLWRWGEAGGVIGASGAVGGLMGAYCVLWGMRKVRFFYWLVVVFNYVKAPALVLLPAWLGWELWQLWRDQGSGVSFEAHVGGILSGALLALGVRLLRWQREEFFGDDLAHHEVLTEARQAVVEALGRMDWFGARRAAEQLAQLDPDSFDSRVLIWRAWSTATGAPPQLHAAARAALTAQPRRLDQLAERKRIWFDYQRATGGQARLTRDELLELGEWFAGAGELDLGLGLLQALRDQPQLAASACLALLRLALARRDHDPAGFQRIHGVLEQCWPQAEETHKLRQLARLG